jgi:hypothetical protein
MNNILGSNIKCVENTRKIIINYDMGDFPWKTEGTKESWPYFSVFSYNVCNREDMT